MESKVVVPAQGKKITLQNGKLNVPENPIIPYIEGDGIGVDVTPAMLKVVDAAVEKAYKGERKISWMEIYTGEKSTQVYGQDVWLPAETLDLIREYRVAINSADAEKVIKFLREEMGVKKIRFPEHCGIGIKPCSEEGTKRLVRAAIEYAIANDRDSVTLVHKGNIMKFTEGAFKDWGYQLAREEFGGELIDGGPWLKVKNPNTGKEIVIKDVIADAFLQQILLRPAEYDVIACMNLNGDYISDALAAQVGGIGIAPGANIGDECALFEATHGTAPKYAGQDKVNPGSIILSAEMMLRHMGWTEAADLIVKGMEGAINAKTVTYDFERLMEGAKLLKCSEFGDAIIKNM